MDNSATLMHHSNHSPIHQHALQLSIPRIRQELNNNALYKLGIHSITIPTPITTNLWILTSTTESDPAGITLIYPDKAPLLIKVQKPIHVLHLPPACSSMSQHFYLPPCYEDHKLTINISLNTANLNRINISSLEFRVWQHLEYHWYKTQLHKLADIPTVPVAHLYKHVINNNGHIIPFALSDEST